MKNFTYSQILNALNRCIKENWRSCEILDAFANPPFTKSIIKLVACFDSNTEIGREGKHFEIPIHILIDDVNVKKAVVAEITKQTHAHGELSYYKDDAYDLIFENFNFSIVSAFSTDSRGYAVFHEEQECGFSWLVITPDDLTAPITYESNYRYSKDNKMSTFVKRVETNRVLTSTFKVK